MNMPTFVRPHGHMTINIIINTLLVVTKTQI